MLCYTHNLGLRATHSCTDISVRAQLDRIVQCRASINCDGTPGDNLGLMTVNDCCIGNGFAYTNQSSTGDDCTACIGEYRYIHLHD